MRQIHKQPLRQVKPPRVIIGYAKFGKDTPHVVLLKPDGKRVDQLHAAIWRGSVARVVELVKPAVIEVEVLMRLVHNVMRGIIKQKLIVIKSPTPRAAPLIPGCKYQSLVIGSSNRIKSSLRGLFPEALRIVWLVHQAQRIHRLVAGKSRSHLA